mmetsp:Transcript_20122/g.40394  ORF Transcript_20122/g.40394 Transcript_20122/m.40394 type:complete len:304 (+) Transcript_20122:171-1082(+)
MQSVSSQNFVELLVDLAADVAVLNLFCFKPFFLLQIVQLEWFKARENLSRLVASLPEMIDNILQAEHPQVTQLLFNDHVISDGNFFPVVPQFSPLQEETPNTLQRGVPVVNVRTDHPDKVVGGFVVGEKDGRIEFLESASRQGIQGLFTGTNSVIAHSQKDVRPHGPLGHGVLRRGLQSSPIPEFVFCHPDKSLWRDDFGRLLSLPLFLCSSCLSLSLRHMGASVIPSAEHRLSLFDVLPLPARLQDGAGGVFDIFHRSDSALTDSKRNQRKAVAKLVQARDHATKDQSTLLLYYSPAVRSKS